MNIQNKDNLDYKDLQYQSNRIMTGANTQNKWHNVYWFSRMLINNDKYVAIGKEPKLLSTLSSSLRLVAKENKGDDTLNLQKQILRNIIEDRYKKTTSRDIRVHRMLDELDAEINTLEDMDVFIITCENIMIPLNQAITNVPNDDREYTLNIAKSYLDVQGKQGLATVISLWDDLGVRGCLTAERTEIVRAFATLRVLFSKDNSIAEEDRDIVLTAFTQEFERRVAQKRKKRAGGSLEDVTDFILDYYKIKRAEAPAHFQADIEVDNWVKTKDGWLIGISCKRTLRERWKQVSSAEATVLSKFKIKHIYHIVTFDEDLSDDKLTLLGGHRHIFYLPDNSRRLKYASEHIGLKGYVRPISQLINDIRDQLK
ncbi:PDDEXK family nuclease [Viscerimonas tarda]